VQENLVVSFGQQFLHGIAQHDAAFTESDTAAKVYDCYTVDLTSTGLHGHWEASLPSPEVFIRFSGAKGSGMFFTSSPLPWSRITITRSFGVRSIARATFFPGSY